MMYLQNHRSSSLSENRGLRIVASFVLAVLLALAFTALLTLTTERPAGSQTDTDNDGLSDAAETSTHGTDPTVGDTDQDGLSDGVEVTLETDPLSSDSDGDGVSDAEEYLRGSDPLVANTAEPAADETTATTQGPVSSTSIVSVPQLGDSVPEALAFADDSTESGSPAWYLLPFAMGGVAWLLLKDWLQSLSGNVNRPE